jgi:hypothetical protein
MKAFNMKIDFNNVRKQALVSLEKLIKQHEYAVLNCASNHDKPYILGLGNYINDLRSDLVAIAASYDEGNPDIIDMLGEKEVSEAMEDER